MHIPTKGIQKLDGAFKKKYDKELISKNLGQFHSDFDMKNCKNIDAVESIFLGKNVTLIN